MRVTSFITLLTSLVFTAGCAQITETVKVIWGSSTRALENARTEAITKRYECGIDECFDAVLAMARSKPVTLKDYSDTEVEEETQESDETGDVSKKPIDDGFFDVFIKNRAKHHIVVMGVPGNVDSTEVGIFFTRHDGNSVKLEVSSLSSSAKRRVAETVFQALDMKFTAVD